MIPAGSNLADVTWDPSPDRYVDALVGDLFNVYVGGSFTNIGGRVQPSVAKVGRSGTGTAAIWASAATSGQSSGIQCLKLIGTNLYVGGDFEELGGQWAPGLAQLDITTGAKNPASRLCVAITTGAEAVARQDDGKVLVGGGFLAVNGQERWGLARVHVDGSLDTNWIAHCRRNVGALAVYGTNIYAGGSFDDIGGTPRHRVAKLSYDTGAALPGWTNDADGTVYSLACDSNWVYLAGSFDNVGGQSRPCLARIAHATGTVDPGWNPAANGSVEGLALDVASLYVGGSFSTVGGQSRTRLAKLNNTTGAADPTWNPGASGYVYSLAVNSSAVFAAGEFDTIGGQSRDYVAKLNKTDGSADPAWNAKCEDYVYAVAADDVHVYCGGDFEGIGGTNFACLARLGVTNGLADAAWDVDVDYSINENGLKLYGADLYAIGAFDDVSGLWRPGFVMIEPFAFKSILRPGGALGAEMTWRSRGGHVYDVNYSTNLADGFAPLVHDIPAAPEQNTFVDNLFPDETRIF